MDTFSEIAIRRAADYAKRLDCRLVAKLGFGVDGIVLQTDRQSAIKIFEHRTQYYVEHDVYLRLQEGGVTQIQGHNVPQFIGSDDELQILEISIVTPPYILDFAKAELDFPTEFPAEVMQERLEYWASLFEGRWPKVQAIMQELESRYGIFLLDPHPRNIAFADPAG